MNKLITSIIAYFMPKPSVPNLGANLDNRTYDEKAKDYYIDEIVAAAAPVTWKNKTWAEFRRFGVQDQDGSSSCVWHTMRKLYRVLFKVNRGIDLDFSATYGYRQRSNYPAEGTIADDAWRQAAKGITLNAVLPSDRLSEREMNTAVIEQYHRDIAAPFKVPNFVQFRQGDFDTVVSTIAHTKKAVMLWFHFTADEWGREVPVILEPSLSLYDARGLKHSVAAVDYGIYNGQRGIFIEDSAHFGGISERFITEAFFKSRNWYAAYPINFVFEADNGTVPETRPRYDGSVKSLQDCLKVEGLFPLNTESTGIFGAITTKAVKGFQQRYGMQQVGTVGPLTRQKLLELYP